MNTIFKVIWNTSLNIWVAVGEFAKGKQKSTTTRLLSASQPSPDASDKRLPAQTGILAALVMGVLGIQPALAIDAASCNDMGESCAAVSNFDELKAALEKGSATTILLLKDIAMIDNINVNQATSDRKDLVIEGGKHSLTMDSYSFNFSSQINDSWWGPGSLTLSNMIIENYSPGGANPQLAQANNIKFTGIFSLSAFEGDSRAVFRSNADNAHSIINFSNTARVTITTGDLTDSVNSTGAEANGFYQYILEDGARFTLNSDQNIFGQDNNGLKIGTYDADLGFGRGVQLRLSTREGDAYTTGNVISNIGGENLGGIGNGASQSGDVIYNLSAGSYLSVLGKDYAGILATKTGKENNAGIYISSGAIIDAGMTGIVARHDGTGNILVENKANGTITADTGIYVYHTGSGNILVENQAVGTITADTGIVAYHLGSADLTVANKGSIASDNIGINASLNGNGVGTSTGDIFLKNELEGIIVAGNIGINASLNGSANLNIVNKGTINSTGTGIAISSEVTQTVNVDNTGGTINATDGTGINILGNAWLNLLGGTINTIGTAYGFAFADTSTSGVHRLADLIINLSDDSTAFEKAADVKLALNRVTLNTANGTALNNLDGLTFFDSNSINVTGTGTGIAANSAALSNLTNAKLDINVSGAGTGINSRGGMILDNKDLKINVTHSGGTGLQVTDGENNTTTIGYDSQINAAGATAINFSATSANTLINYGMISGAVTFAGSADNSIDIYGKLVGSLTTGSGNDALVFRGASRSSGLINLGDGNNNVTIEESAQVSSITTGAGDDTFNFDKLTMEESHLGTLNAGSGSNTLNFYASAGYLAADTSLQNFANINLANSQITLVSDSNIDSGVINIDSDSELHFGNGFKNTLKASVGSGDGSAIIDSGANVTLSQVSAFAGNWQVNQGGTLIANGNNQLGKATIALSGSLDLNNIHELDNALTGKGLLNIDTTNRLFNFGRSTGNAFAGQVDMKNSIFTLGDNNTAALTNAFFIASAGTSLTVGEGNQAVGNFNLNGATAKFDANSLITTDKLAVTNNSTIRIDPILSTPQHLLDQDAGSSSQLINSNNTLTAEELARLTLQNSAGNSLNFDTVIDVIQDTNTVAQGIYGYALSSADKGLSISSILKKLDLTAGQTLTLTSQGALDINKAFTAQLSGSGDLVIGADNSEMTLNNSANDYTGRMSVNGGILNLGSNDALGQTSALITAANTQTKINGYRQTIGALTNAGTITLGSNGVLTSGWLTNTHTLDVTGGTLNLSAGGTSTKANGLIGAGILNISGGDLVINAANNGLSGQINIASGASASLNDDGTLGSSAIAVLGDLNLNGVDTRLNNILSGNGDININGAVTLTGNNTFGGTHHIGAAGALTFDKLSNLGASMASVRLDTATSTLIANGVNDSIANGFSGVADSTIIFNGSDTSLTADNSGFFGQYMLRGNSKLTVATAENLGAGSHVVLADGQDSLVLRDYNGIFANHVSGKGILQVTGNSAVTLTDSNGIGSAVTVDIADATMDLDDIARFNNTLTGSNHSVLNVVKNDASTAFDFGSAVGGAFNGIVNLTNSTFTLNTDNTAALANATLKLSADNTTTVGTTDRTLHGLDLSGGTLIFDGAAPQSQASGVITVAELALNSGIISVTGTERWNNQHPVVAPNLSILDQDRGNIMLELINGAPAMSGNANNLNLMINGTSVTSGSQAVQSTIQQGGNNVAKATYNYGLTSRDSNGASGLYVNYGLKALELFTDGADALLLATDSSISANKVLDAMLSGVGGLQVDASNSALTLANGNNSYRGTTTVNAGELILGANNAFGQTSLLNVVNGASATINGYSQTIGALTNAGTVTLGSNGVLTSGWLTNTHTLDVTGGTLNLSAGGTSTEANGLIGAGTVNINGGDLAINAANNGLSGQINIASGASTSLNDDGTLGNSAINVLGDLNLNGADTRLDNILSGNGDININGAVTLTGNNTFGGTHHIGAAGVLTFDKSSNLGASMASVRLDTATSTLIANGVSDSIANVFSGVADSTIIFNGSDTSLTADNSGFFGQYMLRGNSKLTVASAENLGAGSHVVLSGAQDSLALRDFNGIFANRVNGNGILQVTGKSEVTLTDSNGIDNAVTVDIDIATLNLDNIAQFNNVLTGNGTLNVAKNDASTAFDFGSAVGSAFNGIVNLQNATFNLDGMNTSALTNATLTLFRDSVTSVADGIQKIGALSMNGGTVLFNNLVDNAGVISSAGSIVANSIDTTGGGNVRVNLPAMVTPDLAGLSVLELDEGATLVTLASGAAKGTGHESVLTDENGDPLSPDVHQKIYNTRGTEPAAIYSFNYGLTTGNHYDGLYVNYGLKSLELIGTGADGLILTATLADNSTQSNDLSAQITGSGDLTFISANDGSTASLSNSANNYTGATWVRSGNLRLDADAALGQTSLLAMSTATQVDFNGTQQTVGQLTTETGSTLDLNNGKLTVTDGGQVDGALIGRGELDLTAGALSITQSNGGFTGITDIARGATAHLYQVQGLGSGAIHNNGTLNLDNTAGILSNTLTGNDGNILLTNQATIQLAGDNSGYSGLLNTEVGTVLTANNAQNLGDSRIANGGKLILDTASDWNLTNNISGDGALIKRGTGTVNIEGSTVSASLTTIEGGLLQLGSSPATSTRSLAKSALARSPVTPRAANAVNLTSNVLITEAGSLGGYGKVSGNVENHGKLVVTNALTDGDLGTFTIDGNYTAVNGTVMFDTLLAGDASVTDRLLITGNTTGQSDVMVNNIGSTGARTAEGIKLIDINGSSAGQFTLNGRAVSGAYEYFLYQGGVSSPTDGDWYLRTNANERRPEPASYMANLVAANMMFVSSLSDRAGETLYTDVLTGEEKKTSLWLRNEGTHNRSRDASGKLNTQDNRYVTQLGGNVAQWSRNIQDLWRVGVMAGYANSSSASIAQNTGYRSTGSVDGYSLGMYGSWFADGQKNTGVYIDSWLQYSWFNNQVNGQNLSTEKYDSKGFTTSVESGYTFEVAESAHHSYFIQPKAQIIWMGVKADSQTETNGTVVSGGGNRNIQTRLGVKGFINPLPGANSAKGAVFKPYVETNWIHNTKDFGSTLDGITVKQAGAANIAELKLGAEVQMNNKLNLWGNVAQQVGNHGYSDTSVVLGVKYNF